MTKQVELERAYVVHLEGPYCGTDSYDLVICRPSELSEVLDTMAWEHHDQWSEPDEDDDGCDQECQSGATGREYTPENMEEWDCHRSGGGSFTDEKGVKEVWAALGYSRPKFDGESDYDAMVYILRWGIPICQAGASWQELENWRRQIRACQDVVRSIRGVSGTECCPPLLQTQLAGALVMAENEVKLLTSKVQKVVARLKAL